MLPASYAWKLEEADEGIARTIAAGGEYPLHFARLLAGRGIRTPEEAHAFMHADERSMYDPFLMKDMDRAAARVCRAIERGEHITIYGDYDVDGITATSILYSYLRGLTETDYYLPDRLTEGYGVNAAAVRRICERGTRLIITVDTGITAAAECALAAELGMEIIVTDHHECQEVLPEAVAVLDAKRPDETYPYRLLAGCGVAYKLVQAVHALRGGTEDITAYLELAAVGTIADLVPLTGENRMIVRAGFDRMTRSRNIGLKKLLEVAGYDPGKRRSAGDISFGIGPRLNAAGRMGDAERGVRLFTTGDEGEAFDIALSLEQENTRRKEMEALILEQVTAQIESTPRIRQSYIMVTAGRDWHHGVVGIVSSRIKERYYRPNIILSIGEDGLATGSARSIDGFNLFEALKACSDLLVRYGGHEAAAGMTLRVEDIPAFEARLQDYAKGHMDSKLLIPTQRAELMLTPGEVSLDLVRLIRQMEPFGQGMEAPRVIVRGRLSEVRRVGADKNTLKLTLQESAGRLGGVGFKRGAAADFYRQGMEVSALGELDLNEFRGEVSPQLHVQDIRADLPAGEDLMLRFFEQRHLTPAYEQLAAERGRLSQKAANEAYILLRHFERQQMAAAAAFGAADSGDGFARLLLTEAMAVPGRPSVTLFELLQSLIVFEELGLAVYEISGPYLAWHLIPDRKARLADSAWYRRFFG